MTPQDQGAGTDPQIDQAWAEIRDTMADNLLNLAQKEIFVKSILSGSLAHPTIGHSDPYGICDPADGCGAKFPLSKVDDGSIVYCPGCSGTAILEFNRAKGDSQLPEHIDRIVSAIEAYPEAYDGYALILVKWVRATFGLKGIDPTQGNPKFLADLDSLIAIQTGDGTLAEGYMRGLANGLILARSTFTNEEPKYIKPLEPRKAQGEESDGPQGSPLNARELLARYLFDFHWDGRMPWEDSVDPDHVAYYGAADEILARLNAERSDAPTPNLLETAEESFEAILKRHGVYSKELETDILRRYEFLRGEITRTGGRECWVIDSIAQSELFWNKSEAEHVMTCYEAVAEPTIIHFREVPGSTAGEDRG